jgi:hypothetical protein
MTINPFFWSNGGVVFLVAVPVLNSPGLVRIRGPCIDGGQNDVQGPDEKRFHVRRSLSLDFSSTYFGTPRLAALTSSIDLSMCFFQLPCNLSALARSRVFRASSN